MASRHPQTDFATWDTTLAILNDLLEELGRDPAHSDLQPGAHLERDLGLGSLERVELLLRLNSSFGVQLPEQALAGAETVGELVGVVQSSLGAGPIAEPAPKQMAERGATVWVPLPDTIETIVDVLRYRAGAMGDQPHVYLEESENSERVITYGRLLERATSVARWLEFRGLEPGDRVALMLPTSEEFLASFFGVLLAGGIPIPIYPPLRADRIEEYAARQSAILRSAEARALITFHAAERVARLLKPDVPSLDRVIEAEIFEEVRDKPVAGLRHRPKPDDICFLQYTSGSTGTPKGVMVTHAGLAANIRAMGQAIGVQAGDCAVSWLPLYHDMGLIGAWLLPLFYGFPLVLLSPVSFLTRPVRWLRAIDRHRATLTAGPNFAYELCVRKIPQSELEGLDLSSLRGAMNGAEPVLPETLERFGERFSPFGLRPNAVIPVYGLAEATLAVSVPPLGRPTRIDRIQRERFETEGFATTAPEDPHALAFVSVGVPIGCQARIVDSQGRDSGERKEGGLWFRGPSATQGYFRNPAATAEILRGDGWVDSGDRAYWAEGEIFITGRTKDIIIKGGRNLYPHEIEEAVGRVEGVRRGCVVAFGIPDAQMGTERLVVVAETRDVAARARIEADIVETTSKTVGVPPDIVQVVPAHSIPKTSSGKLRHTETRRIFLEGRLGVQPPPIWRQMIRMAARAATPRKGGVARFVRRSLDRLYGAYALAMFAVWLAPTGILVALVASPRTARGIASAACRRFLWTVGCGIRIEGGEILDQIRAGRPWPCVFSANHTSYLDVVVLLAVLPIDCLFSAKMEVLGWPLLGIIARKMGEMGFDRSDPRARLRQAEQIEEALRQGLSVVVFPEGTFTPAPGVRPFLLGAFKAASDANRPVVPLALRGTREIWRDHTLLPRPGRVTLTFGSPIEPEGADWKQIVRLRDAARVAIAGPAGEPLL